MEHSYVGASSISKVLACPASVELGKRVKWVGDTSHADLGTAAHQLGEACLRDGSDTEGHIGTYVTIGSGEKFKVTSEMASDVQTYLNAVRQTLNAAGAGAELRIEQRISLNALGMEVDAFGTSDAVILDVANDMVHVFDYKNGFEYVPVEDNPQLIYYAIGTLLAIGKSIQNVTLHIVQPNAIGYANWRSYTMGFAELGVWAKKFKDGIALTVGDVVEANVGNWCRYCKAKTFCPAFNAYLDKIMENGIMEITETKLRRVVALPAVEQASTDQLEEFLIARKLFEKWFDDMEAELEYRALHKGESLKEFKMGETNRHRIWADEETAEKELTERLGEEAYSKKLISPAAAEKRVGKALVSTLDYKPQGKLKLVPINDYRKAVNPKEDMLASLTAPSVIED